MQDKSVMIVLALLLVISMTPNIQSATIGCNYKGRHSVTVTIDNYGTVSGCTIPAKDPYKPKLRINMWLGIPYAKSPEDFKREKGENEWAKFFRFRKPEKPSVWKSPYDATYYRPSCPQMYWYIRETVPDFSDTSEDCLYLNIFAPNHTDNLYSSNNYPVMVFIHGGGFTMGSARQWPAMMIAERNVVVVTMNYRLGPLGFLSTGDAESPGNYGLWDQYEALKFVKLNIHKFKGDPERVTLFGQSAGAASIGYHVMSPQTHANSPDAKKSHFQKVIYMSGSDLNDWAVIREKWKAEEYARELAGLLGCPTTSNYELVQCLQVNRRADEIVNASAYIRVKEERLGNPWAPIVDGAIVGSRDAYILKDPAWTRRQGHFPHLRVMGGLVRDEGSWFIPNLPNLPIGIYKNEFENIVLEFLEDQGCDNLLETLEAVRFKYTYWPQSTNETMIRQMLTDLMSDYMFGTGVFDVLRSHAPKNRTYAYVFDYKSYNDYLPSWRGIAHGQELQYVFGFPFFNETYQELTGVYPRQRYTYGDNETAEIMISLFTNFSVYDDPTKQFRKNFPKWDVYNIVNHTTMIIRNQSSSYMHLNYRQSFYSFWTHYYPSLCGRTKDDPKPKKPVDDMDNYTIATYTLVAVIILLLIIIIVVMIRVCKRNGKDEFNDWGDRPYHSTHHTSMTSI